MEREVSVPLELPDRTRILIGVVREQMRRLRDLGDRLEAAVERSREERQRGAGASDG